MKKKRLVVIMLMAVLVLLAGCASKNDTGYSYNMNSLEAPAGNKSGGNAGVKGDQPRVETTTVNPEETKAEGESNSELNDSARKLIRKISIEYETLAFEDSVKLVTEELKKAGGYIENSSIHGNVMDKSSSRYAEYVMRIPVEKVDDFISMAGENMNQVSRNDSSEDVTLKYVDTESELKALEIQQERLLALLEKADKIEDIIALEERLATVRYQLEQNASIIRTYDNLVEYATITLSINEVIRITQPEPKSNWDRMTTGFKNTLVNIRDGFVEFFIWFVINLPYLLFWGVIIGVAIFIYLKKSKRLRNKKGSKSEEMKEDVKEPKA
ncbi:DUF4349 domain-containing protein [Anaerocolumna sp. AGMB13020]|uniref:DUF4349 domain-containing protein n=1 Tax=Anaerocolumna sp. AGMB13020 TaxID=3081750 RepID=UPI002953CB7B|nr:DUF4349 domain-containing protein [Anaerocolumna sp. AGMB13020]WOO36396.1 DUF4349 domain-containing protein [Anaerocolumna sp. AGMB13020]